MTRAIVSRLTRLVYPPGDPVFQEGDIASEMFFIASGTVTIQYKGEHVATLTIGSYFGEFALLEVLGGVGFAIVVGLRCWAGMRAANMPLQCACVVNGARGGHQCSNRGI